MQFCGPLITSLAYVELLSLFNDLCGCSIIIHSVVLSHDYDIQNSLIFIEKYQRCLAYSTARLRYESQKGSRGCVQQLRHTTKQNSFTSSLSLYRKPITHPIPRLLNLSRYFLLTNHGTSRDRVLRPGERLSSE